VFFGYRVQDWIHIFIYDNIIVIFYAIIIATGKGSWTGEGPPNPVPIPVVPPIPVFPPMPIPIPIFP
jgi:hypothetical protein